MTGLRGPTSSRAAAEGPRQREAGPPQREAGPPQMTATEAHGAPARVVRGAPEGTPAPEMRGMPGMGLRGAPPTTVVGVDASKASRASDVGDGRGLKHKKGNADKKKGSGGGEGGKKQQRGGTKQNESNKKNDDKGENGDEKEDTQDGKNDNGKHDSEKVTDENDGKKNDDKEDGAGENNGEKNDGKKHDDEGDDAKKRGKDKGKGEGAAKHEPNPAGNDKPAQAEEKAKAQAEEKVTEEQAEDNEDAGEGKHEKGGEDGAGEGKVESATEKAPEEREELKQQQQSPKDEGPENAAEGENHSKALTNDDDDDDDDEGDGDDNNASGRGRDEDDALLVDDADEGDDAVDDSNQAGDEAGDASAATKNSANIGAEEKVGADDPSEAKTNEALATEVEESGTVDAARAGGEADGSSARDNTSKGEATEASDGGPGGDAMDASKAEAKAGAGDGNDRNDGDSDGGNDSGDENAPATVANGGSNDAPSSDAKESKEAKEGSKDEASDEKEEGSQDEASDEKDEGEGAETAAEGGELENAAEGEDDASEGEDEAAPGGDGAAGEDAAPAQEEASHDGSHDSTEGEEDGTTAVVAAVEVAPVDDEKAKVVVEEGRASSDEKTAVEAAPNVDEPPAADEKDDAVDEEEEGADDGEDGAPSNAAKDELMDGSVDEDTAEAATETGGQNEPSKSADEGVESEGKADASGDVASADIEGDAENEEAAAAAKPDAEEKLEERLEGNIELSDGLEESKEQENEKGEANKKSEWGDDDDDVADTEGSDLKAYEEANAASGSEDPEGSVGSSEGPDEDEDEVDGEARNDAKQASEWGDDDDDDNVSAVAVDSDTATGNKGSMSSDKAIESVVEEGAGLDSGEGEVATKTEEQIESEIESEIEQALEDGELDEDAAEELEEEMEEALEEGMGEVFEEKLEEQLGQEVEDSDDEVKEPSASDAVDDTVAGSGGVATIGLSYDKAGSTVLVDDPPVIGEAPLRPTGETSADTGGKGTTTEGAEEASLAFENLDCKDEPTGFPKYPGTGSNVRLPCEEMTKETCDKVLFSVDLAAPAANVRVEEEITPEESPKDLHNDAKDDERRKLVWSEDSEDDANQKEVGGWGEESLDQEANLNAPSLLAEKATVASDKLVVTFGSRYCPATCDALAQCRRARDHFNPAESSNQVDKDASEDEDAPSEDQVKSNKDATEVGEEKLEGIDANPSGNETKLEESSDAKASASGDGIDLADRTSADATAADKAEDIAEGVGEETVDEGMVATAPTCEDDPSFLYKLKPGMDCAYIGKYKPEKCQKLHDGEKVGVESCPVSCGMVEECEAKLGVSAPLDDETIGSEDDEVAVSGEVTGLNDVVVEDQEDGEDIVESRDEIGDNNAPAEPTGDAATVAEVVCEDDPDFLYKLKAGMDCEYIGKYKADKCLKLHDGVTVGASSCPQSCNMVKECKEMYNLAGGVSELVSDGSGEGVVDNVAEEGGEAESAELGEGGDEDGKDMNAAVFGSEVEGTEETGTADDEGDNVPYSSGEPMDEDNAIEVDEPNVLSTGEGQEPEQEQTDGGYLNNENAWSADSEDAPPAVSSEDSTRCKDDPAFRYKDREEETCQYIGKTNPQKCAKLHNGVEIGISSCPESCGMVAKCLGGSEQDIVETGTADDAGDVEPHSSSEEPKHEDNAIEIGEPSILSTEEEQKPEEEPEQEQTDGGYLSNENAWSADSEDAPPAAVSSDDSTRCKDDPAFRYKDREEETCQYIGKTNPQKCAKLHNGVEIGISSCPESCGMVAKCMGEESSVAGEVTGVAVEPDFCKDVPGYRYNGEPERDCAWIQSNVRCEEELEGALASESVVGDTRTIGKFFCAETCGMVAEGCGSAEAENPLSGDEGEDGDGYEDNSLQSPRMGDVGLGDSVDEFQSSYGDATGTKSMADEIDSLGGGSDGALPAFGSTLGSDDEAGYGKEENMGAMGGEENNGLDDDMRYGADDDDNEQGDGSYQSNNWEDKNKGWSSWDSNDEEMEGGNDADEMANWAKTNEAKSWDVNDVTGSAVEENGGSNGWEDNWNENWNGVDSNPTTWDANAESIGSASGGADSFNPGQDVGSFVDNSAPLSAPSANSPNDLAPSPADDWDPYADDDGFPTGLFIALLVILGFFVFKNSRDQREQSQNSFGRGGYQPVQNNSAHNKRW